MPKLVELTAKEVNDFARGKRKPNAESECVSPNLYLVRKISTTGVRLCYWVFRSQKPIPYKYQFANYKDTTLAQARAEVVKIKLALSEGRDPKQEKKEKLLEQVRLEREAKKPKTFGEVAKAWFDEQVKNKKWANDPTGEAHAETNLRLHILPVIKDRPINGFSWADVYDVMMTGSLYTDFPNSARKCRTLINQICSYANAEGLTNIPNPAVIKGALEYKLSHLKVRETGNFPSLPFELLTDFFKHLQTIDSMGARALEFAILTVSRQGQIIKSVRNGVMYGARWSDIDLERGIWFVPAEIVKTKKPFECYLSSYAIKLLNDLPRFGGCPWVFSANGNEPLSNGALLQTIKRMNEQRRKEKKPLWVDPDIKDQYGEPRGVTAHGTARSCFKSWSVSNGNDKRFNEQAVEINMTHKLDDGYSGAYNRAKHEKDRREIMEAWGRFCYTGKYPDEE